MVKLGTLGNLSRILIYGTILLDILLMILSYLMSKRALKPIIEAYEKQTEFVENVSHELRTPLTIIQAKQELLLTNPDSKIIEKSEEINLSLQETRRLSKLIRELMELSKADREKQIIEKEPKDINEIIRKVSEPYKEIAKMQEKNIEYELNYDKQIPLNESKISELFIILLDNAIKYTEAGDKITVKTYAKERKM